MVIARGEPWGVAGALSDGAPVITSDHELALMVAAARRGNANHTPVGPIGLLGGDLAKTVGSRGNRDRLYSPEAVHLPMDVGSALLDGRLHWFVAHLVVRRSWWHGRIVAVMNAQWRGTSDVAPRSHPNDGLLDVFDANLGLGDRFKARRRLRTGTHVPHPGIRQQRTAALQLTLDRPTPIWLDGVRTTSAQELVIRLEPDALIGVV